MALRSVSEGRVCGATTGGPRAGAGEDARVQRRHALRRPRVHRRRRGRRRDARRRYDRALSRRGFLHGRLRLRGGGRARLPQRRPRRVCGTAFQGGECGCFAPRGRGVLGRRQRARRRGGAPRAPRAGAARLRPGARLGRHVGARGVSRCGGRRRLAFGARWLRQRRHRLALPRRRRGFARCGRVARMARSPGSCGARARRVLGLGGVRARHPLSQIRQRRATRRGTGRCGKVRVHPRARLWCVVGPVVPPRRGDRRSGASLGGRGNVRNGLNRFRKRGQAGRFLHAASMGSADRRLLRLYRAGSQNHSRRQLDWRRPRRRRHRKPRQTRRRPRPLQHGRHARRRAVRRNRAGAGRDGADAGGRFGAFLAAAGRPAAPRLLRPRRHLRADAANRVSIEEVLPGEP
mmetsp:Transcript_4679/g.16491  ORF Transcript_4679/g.16491 Transcript_4679/m.16491 type:complete len:405 (-) Transcript_4679:392-1606(-)